MAAMNMVSAGRFLGKLTFKKMSARGRLSTLQENPQFWAPTIKVTQPDGVRMRREVGIMAWTFIGGLLLCKPQFQPFLTRLWFCLPQN
jgi:hypothetical protein